MKIYRRLLRSLLSNHFYLLQTGGSYGAFARIYVCGTNRKFQEATLILTIHLRVMQLLRSVRSALLVDQGELVPGSVGAS